MIGFLFNRVLSNVGFLLAGIYAVSKIKEIFWLFKDRWMWTFIALAALPILYDLFLEGFGFIHERGIMKLILVLFPSFIFAFQPKKRYISLVHLFVILVMVVSSAYTFFMYLGDQENIVNSYKISKVMPVLSYGDHIRISWVVVISLVMALYEWHHSNKFYVKILLILYICGQYTYLHYLGAKTGLISLYVTIILLSYYLIPKGKKWWLILIFSLTAVLGYFAATNIPSLKERVNFVRYDFEHYSKGEYREGLSDAVRFYSLKAGKDIIAAHPIMGVGFSKLHTETSAWYDANMPNVPQKDRFLPSSQLVIYWASGGMLGLLIFLSHLLLPFFRKYLKENRWFMAFFIPAIVSFTFETHLEGQLPIFVYGFFVAWFWWLAWREKQVLQT